MSLVLLLIVFGALIAAGIPLLLAGTAVISAISLLAIPSHWLPIDSTTSSIVLLVGMAVGIDYSLFYLRRTREERAAGATRERRCGSPPPRRGARFVVSGVTVMVAMAGLFLTGIDVFPAIAVGTILVVGVAVLGSLTFLPAILSMLGDVDRPRPDPVARPQRRTAARAIARCGACWPGPCAAAADLGRRCHGRCCWPWPSRLSPAPGDPGIHELPPAYLSITQPGRIQQAFPGGPEPGRGRRDRPGPGRQGTERP